MNVGIILAAGVGSRFGADKPKQFFLLNGKPVLYYTIKSFTDSGLFDRLIVVLSKPYMKTVEKIFEKYFDGYKTFFLCDGGLTRQDSLYNGVQYAINNFGDTNLKIVSHCASRPILSKEILQKNLDMIEAKKSVDTVKRIYDTMLQIDNNGNTHFVDRNSLFVGLTPQSFYAKDYIDAYISVKENVSKFTCACSLMRGAGYEVSLLITDEPIHKITVKEDINIIKQQLKELIR